MQKTLRSLYSLMLKNIKSNLGIQIATYLLFYAVLWGGHLIIISLISFFHLLLDHNIRTIGDWISDRGWTIIIIVKLIVLYVVMLFANLKTDKMYSLKSYFRNSVQNPRFEIIVVYFFFLIAVVGVGNVHFNSTMIIEIHRILLSIVGTFVFFGTDFVLLTVLDVYYPLKDHREKVKKNFIMPAIFYAFSAATFVYEQTISLKLYPLFFLLLYISEWRRKNWTLAAFFLIFFIIPLYSFIGLDPVWGSTYTPFLPKVRIHAISFVTLVAIGIFYLEFIKRKKTEYIYRD